MYIEVCIYISFSLHPLPLPRSPRLLSTLPRSLNARSALSSLENLAALVGLTRQTVQTVVACAFVLLCVFLPYSFLFRTEIARFPPLKLPLDSVYLHTDKQLHTRLNCPSTLNMCLHDLFPYVDYRYRCSPAPLPFICFLLQLFPLRFCSIATLMTVYMRGWMLVAVESRVP